MPYAFPVDAPGFLDLPGKSGTYAVLNRTAIATPPTTVEIIARIRLDTFASTFVGGWGSTHMYLLINTSGTLFMRVLNLASGSIGGANSSGGIPSWGAGKDVWVRGKVTIASALCEYWYSFEKTYPKAWVAIGSTIGSNAGTVPFLTATPTFVFGSNSTGSATFDGRLYYLSETLSGVETFRFDGDMDLAGVGPDSTTFAPSIGPANAVVTIVRTPVASGPGYITLPGTSGNYLEVPDNPGLRLTGSMYLLVRMRRPDVTPNVFSTVVGKGVAYRVVSGPYGQMYSWASAAPRVDTPGYLSPTVGSVSTPDPGPLPSDCTWIYKIMGPTGTFQNDTIASQFDAGSARSWWITRSQVTSDAGLAITPDGQSASTRNIVLPLPPITGGIEYYAHALHRDSAGYSVQSYSSTDGINWSSEGAAVTGTPKLDIFDTSLPLVIGNRVAPNTNQFQGRIYNAELRTGLDPGAGGGVSPIPGYATFHGTNLNYLTTPDAPALRVTKLTVIARLRPTTWTPTVNRYIASRMIGGSVWRFILLANGTLYLGTYDTAGVETIISSGVYLSQSGIVNGQWLWLAASRDPDDGAGNKAGRMYWAPDVNGAPGTWTQFASSVVAGVTTIDTTRPASLDIGTTIGNNQIWDGDIGYVAVRSGVGGAGALGGTDVFRFDGLTDLSPAINPAAASFSSSTAQTVTVNRSGTSAVTLTPGVAGTIWKFDSNDYPGTGSVTVWTDPRGRTWTLTAAGAITPYLPATDFSGSPFGDPGPVDNDWVWYSYFFNPANGSGKMWVSQEDNINPPPDASWELIAQMAGGATSIFAGTDPLRIGAGAAGTPSFQGDIGYVAIKSSGTGAQPTSEGVSIFILGATSFIGVAPDATTVTATTNQVATVYRNPAPTDTGYILFPGTLGNDLVVADAPALDFGLRGSFIFTIWPDAWRPFETQTIFSKWSDPGQRSYAVMMDVDGYLLFLYSTDGTNYITLKASQPVPVVDGPRHFRVDTGTVTVRYVDFSTSVDGIDWTPLGVRQNGPTGAAIFGSTSPLVIGGRYEGRLYEVIIFSATVSTLQPSFRFSPENIPTNPHATSIVVPTGTAMVRRRYVPIAFGFIILPGTAGNYLSVPDAVALRNTVGFVVEARLIPDDWTPAGHDRIIMSKTGTGATDLGWRFILTTRGTLGFQWSTNGTSYANYVESPKLGYIPQSAKRVGVSFDRVGQFVRFWTSDDNREWTRLGSDIPTTGALIASSSALLVGNIYDGAISNFSYRVGFGANGAPAQGTEALLVDETCLNIDPTVSTFLATTGQVVTIVRTSTASDTTETPGWLRFPGTFGNYATVTAAGPPAIAAIPGTITFDMRIAADRWLGQMIVDDPTDPKSSVHYEGPDQTIIGRWSAGNNHSWLLRLSANGEFLFTWTSADGATEYTSTSSRVMGAVNGEFRRLCLTMEMGPSLQTLRLFESLDYGDSWKAVGNPQVTTYPTTGLVQGNGPMWLGSTEGDTLQFGGRIAYLAVCNGAGPDGAPGGTEIFRMDQESLRVPDFSTSFVEALGKTVTLRQSLTPTVSGYMAFDGVTGEYCRANVPNMSALTSTFTILVRVNFTGTQPTDEQVLVQKWNTTAASKVSNKALTTNVATIVTTTPHKLTAGSKVIVSGVDAVFNGTFTVATVPNTTSFTYAKTNANVVSVAATGDVAPLGRSFSLRRKGNEFSMRVSRAGLIDDINAVLADVWDDETTDWGWLAVETSFMPTGANPGATVKFYTAPDVLSPVGTPLVPVYADWMQRGDPLFFEGIINMYMDTEQVTFGGQEDGTLPLRGQISDISITDVLQTEKFGWGITSFAGIAADSGAFTARTGENIVLEPVGSSSRSMHVEPSPPGPTTDIEPSPPGETTTILPAPAGPTTTLVRGEAGLSTTITAAPIAPTLEVVPASLDRPWWPGTGSSDTSKWWTRPAFTVQRAVKGTITGGDYVRGSTSADTQQTAIRYPTTLPGWTAAGVGKGTLYSQPINYDTIEIEWNIPDQLTDTSASYFVTNKALTSNVVTLTIGTHQLEVGTNITVTMSPADPLLDGAYPVTAVTATTVSYARTGANVTLVAAAGSVRGETPSTVNSIRWSEVVIVRAAMGYPATVNDGQPVMRMTKEQLFPRGYIYDATTNTILTPNQQDPRPLDDSADPGLTPGRWYYYALFFRIGLDWVRSAIHCCLLPRNHHHSEHLWNALPPYYRYLDDQQRGGANDGDLKRWLEIFGYQFDLNREYVESMLDMYHTDFTPIALLRRIGENFGVPYEPGLGDYSYRALVGRIGYLYRGRGTVGGMKSLVAAAAKCDCDVTQSPNVMLLPDDSEFINGTGNWAGIHDRTYPVPTGSGIPASPLSYDRIHFVNGTYGFNPGATNGKGQMHVWTLPADATRDLLITCGDGKLFDPAPNAPAVEIIPFNTGTPCKPDDVYGFSISCAVEATGISTWASFWPYLFFFKKGGQPYDYLDLAVGSASVTPLVTAGVSDWKVASVTGTVPAEGAWVVPAIAVVGRIAGPASNTVRSPMIHFSGASIRLIGDASQVTSDLFVKTLSLTGPASGHPGTPADTGAEIIGPVRAAPVFDPFVIGEDKK